MYVDHDVIDPSVHASIKEARAYFHREYKQWYLTVTYSYKDKDGSDKELEIPAFPLQSMTKAEIEEALGYKINIIEEDKND